MATSFLPARATVTKLALLCLKAGNLIAITVYSFALIFILVRVVSPGVYPWIVLMSSIGNYVLATDLGYGGFVYASVRKSFLENQLVSRLPFISQAINIYGLIALASILIASLTFLVMPRIGDAWFTFGLAAFFCSIVLSLPCALMRRAAAAMDLFLEFEVLELARRLSFLGLAGAMLLGLSFLAFALLCLAAWAIAFISAAMLLRRSGVRLRLHAPKVLAGHINENLPNISKSGAFTLLEFFLYNSPYILLPLIFGSPAVVVLFDVFYKVTRFGGVAYSVATETFIPYQTRAFYAGDGPNVRRYLVKTMLVSLIPFVMAAAFILFFGDWFFSTLLNRPGAVSTPLRYAMIAMLAGTLVQSAAGTFLSGIGRYVLLSKLALVVVVALGAIYGMVSYFQGSFDSFILSYVTIYGLYAISFLVAFGWTARAVTPAAPTPRN